MNQTLFELYTRQKPKILDVKSRCTGNMEGPFLISPNDAYWVSTTKVAFVGQETNGWASQSDIALQMAEYTDFNLGKDYYSSPFWNVIRKLESALTTSTYSSAWLNLHRYDQERKRPSTGNQRILSELDFLLLEELRLIAPDVIIFLTGPSYDLRITELLQAKQIPIEGFTVRQLCKIESPTLGGNIFRTYHPNFLRRSGLEKRAIESICVNASKSKKR
ncbi:MAG: hypothetical protein Q8O29_06260 [Polaromonas sp.]|uniref:hypothetical protein n=1 Tax=Polaromonas sp. TaxID=1869339 RepID=UPI002732EB85|nr:hypothetical protein [Polaromonas sp.]MDP2817873.1 hypothetical protein [Polaromonas sp.]